MLATAVEGRPLL